MEATQLPYTSDVHSVSTKPHLQRCCCMPCMLATGSYLQVGSIKTPHMGCHGDPLVALLQSRRHLCIFGSALAAAPQLLHLGP